jgi:hypothetical protein
MSQSWSVVTFLFLFHQLELMRLWLREEDLLLFHLRCGHFHHSTDVATVKVAEELYLTPHEIMHWHEGRLLGSAKPANQLVSNIGEPGDCLKVVTDAIIEVCLCMVCIGGALLGNKACPYGKTYVLKTLTHQV